MGMGSVISFEGPKTCSAVLTSATLNGLYGEGHDEIDQSVDRLLHHRDQFALNGEGFESRLGKFKNTARVFLKGGACSGALLGDAIMVPVDIVAGRGKVRKPGESATFLDDGVLGNGLKLAGAVASGTMEVVGAGVGGLTGVVSLPANGTERPTKEWIKSKAKAGAQMLGKGGAHVAGMGLAMVLNVARLPSIVVKYLLKGVMGGCAGLVGLIAGTIRAAINK